MRRLILQNRSGYSLVEVLISAVVLTVVMAMIGQLIYNSGFFWKLDRQAKGDQVLAYVATALQQTDYDSLITLCSSNGAFSSTPVHGTCLVGNALNPAAVPTGTVYPYSLNVRRTWDGDPSAAGTVCVELTQCAFMAGGRAVQIALTGFWPQNEQVNAFQQRVAVFRRTRW